MSGTEHPSYRELLLLDSGELDKERASLVEEHLVNCTACQREIAKVRSVCGAVAGSFPKEKPPLVKHRIRAIVAVVAAVTVTGYLLTEGTPSARADELLRRAVSEQISEPIRIRAFQLRGPGGECIAAATVIPVASSSNNFCQSVVSALRASGWAQNDLLSAKQFESWRASLSNKKDSVRKAKDVDQIETRTDEGPLRVASLRIRSADYRPISAHYEFAGEYENTAVEVTETKPLPIPNQDMPHPVLPAKAPKLPDHSGQVEVDPADLLEARIRLALHSVRADGSVTLDLQKTDSGFRVWGVVRDEATKQAIRQNLQSVEGVSLEIASEAEAQSADRSVSVPWAGFHGDAPPLAQEELNRLFQNNPQGRQQFLNSLDLLTRQLAGDTKTRDALRKLAGKLAASSDALALKRAAGEFDEPIATLLQQIALQLEPLTGPIQPGGGLHLTFHQAMDLHTLVHQTVLLQTDTNDLTLAQALERITTLLR